MGTISDKLSYLADTKNDIKQAIIDKGVSVSNSDTFRSYASKIAGITTGGSGDMTKAVYDTNNDGIVDKTAAIVETGASSLVKIWVGTKAEYNAITTKDSSTLYITTDEQAASGFGASSWVSGTAYKIGDIVIYENAFYQCNTANSDTTWDVSKYTLIGASSSAPTFVDWVSGSNYVKNQIIVYNSLLYRLNRDVTNSTTSPTADTSHYYFVLLDDYSDKASTSDVNAGLALKMNTVSSSTNGHIATFTGGSVADSGSSLSTINSNISTLQSQVSGLSSAISIKGTVATYAALTALTGMTSGQAYIVTSDESQSGSPKDWYVYSTSGWVLMGNISLNFVLESDEW
jgi:hypothetical protein